MRREPYPLQAKTLGGTRRPEHTLRALAAELEAKGGVDTITVDARAYAAMAEATGPMPDAVDDSLEAQRWRVMRDRIHELVHNMLDLLDQYRGH